MDDAGLGKVGLQVAPSAGVVALAAQVQLAEVRAGVPWLGV
jgi:hypothetical protein